MIKANIGPEIEEKLADLDGKLLSQLHKLYKLSPEYFFKKMDPKNDLELSEILNFLLEFDQLVNI